MTGLYDHKSSYIQGSLRSFVCGESGRGQLHNHKPSYEGEVGCSGRGGRSAATGRRSGSHCPGHDEMLFVTAVSG